MLISGKPEIEGRVSKDEETFVCNAQLRPPRFETAAAPLPQHEGEGSRSATYVPTFAAHAL